MQRGVRTKLRPDEPRLRDRRERQSIRSRSHLFDTSDTSDVAVARRFRLARVGLLLLLFVALLPSSSCTTAAGTPEARDDALEDSGLPDIPYRSFVLDNGLTLIVHEDHKAPIIAVNVWYHVGSKNEEPGKTGFAHLFEHLMFNGSENYDDDYFGPFDRVGATDMNGTTNSDRTNYFQNVPTSALDMVLFMESDRMGHLLGAVDQAKLDEQRGVVQNEKRQRENQPYGRVFRVLTEQSYPAGHPYSWSTIGSMDDLAAASLEDVREWFKAYYGAANAVIAVAGDVDAEEIFEAVERYFGDIPAGPPMDRQNAWIAKRTGDHRMVVEDRVPQARVLLAWNIPGIGTDDSIHLELVGSILTEGKTSRLYRRLVYEDQIATDVVAFVWPRELGGIFVVWATARPGGDLAEVERALHQELERFLADGPEPAELQRAQVNYRAAFLRGIERIGGFGGKSDILASSQIYGGSPDAYKQSLEQVAQATRRQLRDFARQWLGDGRLTMEVQPFREYATRASSVDRSQLPEPGPPPQLEFPALQRTRLPNGLEVILVERHDVSLVNFELLLDAGYAADQFGVEGTANLALNMLDEGTTHRDALEISDALAGLGAELGTGSNLDLSSVTLSALTENLDASLEIFADVVLNPIFSEEEFERLQKQQIAAIQREKVAPRSMALRVLPRLLYGKDHAYGISFTGSGTEEVVSSITRDQLVAFHETWFKPDHAVLVVVGDTTMAEMKPRLEELFADWKPGDIPDKNLAHVELADRSEVYLVDRPGSLQSILFAGHLAPRKANPEEMAIEAMNEVLGGSFSARINMNLREDKHWAYGAYSFFVDARGQRPFITYAPVQTDKTVAAMQEIQKELEEFVGSRPASQDELDRAIDKKTLTLPGRWETNAAVGEAIAATVRFGFPDDYWTRYPEEMRAQTTRQIAAAAERVVRPDLLTWVVVGDLSKIEDEIRAAGFGPIHLVDADGNPVRDADRAGGTGG